MFASPPWVRKTSSPARGIPSGFHLVGLSQLPVLLTVSQVLFSAFAAAFRLSTTTQADTNPRAFKHMAPILLTGSPRTRTPLLTWRPGLSEPCNP